MPKIYVVILAAGRSARLGFNKLTLLIDGISVIRRSVEPFLANGITKIFVVTGHEAERVAGELKGLPVSFIDNPRYHDGMGTSVAASLPFLKDADWVFFHLGDKPFAGGEIVQQMLRKISGEITDRKPDILVPVYDGVKGHPVLFRGRVLDERHVTGLTGDVGLRELIEKNIDDVLCIDGNEGSVFDIDTQESIHILRKRGYRIEKG